MIQYRNREIPFIHLFKSVSGYYLYDVNRDKFLEISRAVYEALESEKMGECIEGLSDVVINEIDLLKKKGYLKSSHVVCSKHPKTDMSKYYIENSIRHLILQVTQNCNLRCEYCIYSGEYRNRTHSEKQMPFNVAKKAIDYYVNHSRDNESLSIGFYGGEPCMNFKLIKQCVEYVKKNVEGRTVAYHMTTNATLLDEEKIRFFKEHDFSILVSLDGPKEIHDKHRKFVFSRQGSYDVVLEKIKYIKEKYPDYCKQRISFNMVIDTENNFSIINEFVKNNDIVSDLRYQANYIDPKNTDVERKTNPIYIEEIYYEKFKLFLELLGKIPKGHVSPLLNNYENEIRELLYDNDNSLILNLPQECHHSGPCIPGNTRLFVNADGVYYPCERVSENTQEAIIGNINNGININAVHRVLNYEQEAKTLCYTCWAYRHCDQCIAHKDNNLDNIKKNCDITKRNLLEKMKDACTLSKLGFDYYIEYDN